MSRSRMAKRRSGKADQSRKFGLILAEAIRGGDGDRFRSNLLNLPIGKSPDLPSGQEQRTDGDRTPALCIHDHEWVVYSTALQEGWLMIQCVRCWAMGTIDDPSAEEW